MQTCNHPCINHTELEARPLFLVQVLKQGRSIFLISLPDLGHKFISALSDYSIWGLKLKDDVSAWQQWEQDQWGSHNNTGEYDSALPLLQKPITYGLFLELHNDAKVLVVRQKSSFWGLGFFSLLEVAVAAPGRAEQLCRTAGSIHIFRRGDGCRAKGTALAGAEGCLSSACITSVRTWEGRRQLENL